MVNNEVLRRWVAEYRIYGKNPGDEWPLAHQVTFQHVERLRKIDLDIYNTDAFSGSHKPWKQHNIKKAAYLAGKSASLNETSANESAWRHGIEGVIVKRLSDEVACPHCKYRLWRSEIEFNRDGSLSHGLDYQIRDREVCECPKGSRPEDPYEVQPSHLFQEIIEGEIIHEQRGRLRLRQKPDRIIGLKETDNISCLLDQPAHPLIDDEANDIRNILMTTPFKNSSKQQCKAMLFPFLVIEAKSHKAQESFADIQTQTALPIRALLDLQWNLWRHGPSQTAKPEPLVWFLGYRGSDWKIYACYRSKEGTLGTSYIIHHLQSGDLMTREGALRLILLFDYIADWARDSYRPSVIRQLSSLATGRDFHLVKLRPDADIMSDSKAIVPRARLTRGNIRKDGIDAGTDDESAANSGDANVNFVHIPTSLYGVIRQMNTVVFRCTGLRITDTNTQDLLPPGHGDQAVGACARELLHQLTRWEEIVVVQATDLGNLELMWSGGQSSAFHKYKKSTESQFYVRFQYRCYIDLDWRIVRELSYLAISPAALSVLSGLAAKQRKLPGLYMLSERLRPCSNAVLQETIDCIRAGSSWQVLRTALSSTAFYLQPCFTAHGPPDERVSFFSPGHVHSTQFSDLLRDLGEEFASRHKCYTVCSIWTSFDNTVSIENPSHDDFSCRRCLASGHNAFSLRDWTPAHVPTRPASGAVLVSALRPEEVDKERQDRHELCLYLFHGPPALLKETPFSTVIERLAKDDQIYHTILHGHPQHTASPEGVLWNLPWPYRKSTKRQKFDIAHWVHDLAEYGSPFDEKQPASWMHIWVHQQMLLYYLRTGLDYDEADKALRAFRNESRGLYRGRHDLPFGQVNLPLSAVRLSRFWAKVKHDENACGGMLD